MKTIAEQWADFESVVIPRSAGGAQRQEMRRAFYAGFHSALECALQAADESGDDDDLGARMLQSLRDECKKFAVAVVAGRA